MLLLEVGVSNCYVFKSRLQEYAQKVGLATPVYETIKEGPSHEPSFRSAVMVGGARYESLSGFFNRKAAEQSAAEVALMELSKSGDKNDSIAVPVVSELNHQLKQTELLPNEFGWIFIPFLLIFWIRRFRDYFL